MELDATIAFLDASPAVRLLRADHAPFVLHFLHRNLKASGEEAAISLSHEEIRHRLQVFQEQLHDEEEDVLTGSPDHYLRQWADAGWLRRFLPADASQPHYQLSRYAEDAIRFVDSSISRSSRTVGTESRLRLVIDTLLGIARGSSADPDRRLQGCRECSRHRRPKVGTIDVLIGSKLENLEL